VRMIDLPWFRKGSGFTLLFEALAMALIENEIPVNKAAALLGEHPNRLWRIFNLEKSVESGIKVQDIDFRVSLKNIRFTHSVN